MARRASATGLLHSSEIVASTFCTTRRDSPMMPSRSPSSSQPALWPAVSRMSWARCSAVPISLSSSLSRRSSSLFSCRFRCVRKKVYTRPVVPVIMAGMKKAWTPIFVCRKAPRTAPERKPTKSGSRTNSFMAPSRSSMRSNALAFRCLQPCVSRIMVARPAVEPMSVAVPVTWVVRTTAPKCMVHMAFWRPHAMAARQPAATARVWVTLSRSGGAMHPAAMSRPLFASRATP
mmetsp:Transcript_96874/g.235477  ORF Transcript_96874/g.235477 Transcript_96874/m.235477 type:complete len:233 (+) Transcript_96874:161-859(+)